MTIQMPLPLRVRGTGLCGYCGRGVRAVHEPDGLTHYQCPRCGPLLAQVHTLADYRRFCREAAR